jgi:preprotein translocase subunit SecF
MNNSLATFMKMAVSVIVIAALLFIVGYKMVDDEVTGTNGYKTTIEGLAQPTTAATTSLSR